MASGYRLIAKKSMGKIRVKTFGNEEEEVAAKAEKDRKRAEKKARLIAPERSDGGQAQDDSDQTVTETQTPIEDLASQGQALEPKEEKTEELSPTKPKKAKKEKFLKKGNKRSAAYSAKVMEIDKNKTYPLGEALELLRKVKLTKFDETVELHINTTQTGISGQVKLPHGNGKEVRIAIADDKVLAEVEKGKINFDILIAAPSMMPKLGKVARVLGPRGLMPNPKNGTISENPEEAAKKFQGGQINFKTEAKNPIMHLSVGKTSFEDSKLSENIKTIILAIKKDRIRNITLKSTMSPAIKLHA